MGITTFVSDVANWTFFNYFYNNILVLSKAIDESKSSSMIWSILVHLYVNKIWNDLKIRQRRPVFPFDGGTNARGNIECIQFPNILLKFFFVAFKAHNIYKGLIENR